MDTIREMRGRNLYLNEVDSDAEGAQPERERASRRLSPAELVTELARRESLMEGDATGVTDQWRVYTHIIESITTGTSLRLFVQARLVYTVLAISLKGSHHVAVVAYCHNPSSTMETSIK